jgi:hypothetical protein
MARSSSKSAAPVAQAAVGHNSKSLLPPIVEEYHRLDRNHVIERGAVLIKAHATAEYGDWKEVCKDEFGISHDTARNLMAVAKVAEKYENFRGVRVRSSTLYQLAGVGSRGAYAEPDYDSLPALIAALDAAAKAAGKTLSIKAGKDVIRYTPLRKKHGNFPDATLDALDEIDEADWPEAVKQLKEKKPATADDVDALLIALRRSDVAAIYKVEVAALPAWLDDSMLADMEEVPAKYRKKLLKKLQATPEEEAPNFISDLTNEFEIDDKEAAAGEQGKGEQNEDAGVDAQVEPEQTVVPFAPARAAAILAKREEAETNDKPAETPQVVPLDRNPICRVWRLATEDERAGFARLFGDDVQRYAEDDDQEETDDEPPQQQRGKKPKVVSREETLGDAIDSAFEELTELASECREVVDNAEGGLAETERIQTLGATADTLENFSEPPDVPDELSEIKVAYELPKRRYDSRGSRAADACVILTACVSVLVDIKEDDPRHQQAVDLSCELESAASEVEGCEFPGMYG